jgi:hypothetical protein
MKPQKNPIRILGAILLLLAMGQPQAHAYTHPCVPTTCEELDTIKASLNQEPWKSVYAALAAYPWNNGLYWNGDGQQWRLSPAP